MSEVIITSFIWLFWIGAGLGIVLRQKNMSFIKQIVAVVLAPLFLSLMIADYYRTNSDLYVERDPAHK